MRLAYLEKIDPARKMSRFYAICVTPTLFGQWAVVREWGRIGQASAVRENWADASVAVVDKGAAGKIDTKTFDQPVVAFVFGHEGLMGGLSLEGSKIQKLNLKA